MGALLTGQLTGGYSTKENAILSPSDPQMPADPQVKVGPLTLSLSFSCFEQSTNSVAGSNKTTSLTTVGRDNIRMML